MLLVHPMLTRYPERSLDIKEVIPICDTPVVCCISLYINVMPGDMLCNLDFRIKRELECDIKETEAHIDVSNKIFAFPTIERSKFDGRSVYIPLNRSLIGRRSLSGYESGR